jgi:hypothetical protein
MVEDEPNVQLLTVDAIAAALAQQHESISIVIEEAQVRREEASTTIRVARVELAKVERLLKAATPRTPKPTEP